MTIDDDKEELRNIVKRVRRHWPKGLTNKKVKEETSKLGKLRRIRQSKPEWKQLEKTYCFDDDKYPDLSGQYSVPDAIPKRPGNLAEALLWKDGNWSAYKKFLKDYKPRSNPDASGRDKIVYYAFARHLRSNKKSPIFDQHSARALWAIAKDTWQIQHDPFRNFLLQGIGEREHWKSSPGGAQAYSCWQEYCNQINRASHLDLERLDKLLMPLGQALKDFTKYECTGSKYANFCDYFGVKKRVKQRPPNRSKRKT